MPGATPSSHVAGVPQLVDLVQVPGLGTALTVAFPLQVTPSVWAAYRADRTTGIAKGTWLLIFGELADQHAGQPMR